LQVIYIAGAGRSGSTILDILLSNQKSVVGCGELVNVCKAYQKEELCSCGVTVNNCSRWGRIINTWKIKYGIDEPEFKKFIELDYKFCHPRLLSSWLSALGVFRQKDYEDYIENLSALFDVIFETTGARCFCDSSKSPLRIISLKKALPPGVLKVVHLKRNVKEVADSLSRPLGKNLEKGVQHNLPAKNRVRTFAWWHLINLMVWMACILCGLSRQKVNYNDLVSDPNSIAMAIDPSFIYAPPLKPDHIPAGNRLRMKSEIYISTKK
jgi:hypothetical protein